MLRAVVLGKAGSNGDAKVIEQAKQRFAAHVSGKEGSIAADLRFTVYKLVCE